MMSANFHTLRSAIKDWYKIVFVHSATNAETDEYNWKLVAKEYVLEECPTYAGNK